MRSQSRDMKRRSSEPWERGRGARRIGNPRYMPKIINGVKRYVLRKSKNK